MIRQLFGLFTLATLIVVPASSWAADGRSDTEIARAIVEAFQQKQRSDEIRGFNIGVRVEAGKVWVDGKVSQPEHRDLILDVARRVPGVKQVAIDIKLTPPKSPLKQSEKPDLSDAPVSAKNTTLSSLIYRPGDKAITNQARPVPQPCSLAKSPYSFAKSRKETADRVVKSIRSKNECGELTGFDISVDATFTPAVILIGRVADEQTRDLLTKTVRDQTGISPVSCHIQIAEEGVELPDKVSPAFSPAHPPYPSYAWPPKPTMDWDEGWWLLDFKSKKHR